jgi:flagellar assembly protein FliH
VKERKYYFDLNNFDEEPIIEIEEEAPPPPPTFSLDDIGSAKEISFEDGRQAGLAEAETLRAQYIAEQLHTLANHTQDLIAAEQYRNATFEREVLSLVHTIIETTFPQLAKTNGLNDIKVMIHDVLSREIKSPHIVIETPIDDAEDIQNFIDSLQLEQNATITIRADPNLSAGTCKILWREGGAVRDHTAIAKAVLTSLKPPALTQSRTPLAPNDENDQNKADQNEGES